MAYIHYPVGDDGYATLEHVCDTCNMRVPYCDCDDTRPSRDTSKERIR